MNVGRVFFIGAGPGDPELLTLKGQRLIREADLVLYAGSLVPPEVVACAKEGARVEDSSPLCLEETHALMRDCALGGGMVARVHTGDPALYGAVREQARLLDADGIPWEVVPGVSAAFAAAAAGKVSFTVPEVTQSLVITRLEGRTPVPERERLRKLAAHGSSLALYLSASEPDRIQAELLAALPPDTPILCAYRVGRPDQRMAWARVDTLADLIREQGFTRQTVFLVLPGQSCTDDRSKLYDAAFTHGRRGKEGRAETP